MLYDIDIKNEDKELLKRIINRIQKYEKECMKKNDTSSPTQIKKMIEDMCNEN